LAAGGGGGGTEGCEKGQCHGICPDAGGARRRKEEQQRIKAWECREKMESKMIDTQFVTWEYWSFDIYKPGPIYIRFRFLLWCIFVYEAIYL
jgi:hypothetical protein